jgi:hypothetical protein
MSQMIVSIPKQRNKKRDSEAPALVISKTAENVENVSSPRF